MEELNECPKCGGKLEVEFESCFGRIFRCVACGIVIPAESKEAIAAWNRRVEE